MSGIVDEPQAASTLTLKSISDALQFWKSVIFDNPLFLAMVSLLSLYWYKRMYKVDLMSLSQAAIEEEADIH